MTFGDRLSALRKENNFTQEQLAELVGVSRQAVSKWESDTAMPETDKLMRLSELFECSVDYLLKGKEKAKVNQVNEVYTKTVDVGGYTLPVTVRIRFPEYRSKTTVFGLPLVDVGRNAKGIFAFGLKARGIVSGGVLSCGIISFGVLSMGLFSFGVLSLALLAVGVLAVGLAAAGAFAVGIISAGAFSLGVFSLGALAAGDFAAGALAMGKYAAMGDEAKGMIAIGKTAAEGTLFSKQGTLTPADRTKVIALLQENVPQWLSWARDLFIKLL